MWAIFTLHIGDLVLRTDDQRIPTGEFANIPSERGIARIGTQANDRQEPTELEVNLAYLGSMRGHHEQLSPFEQIASCHGGSQLLPFETLHREIVCSGRHVPKQQVDPPSSGFDPDK